MRIAISFQSGVPAYEQIKEQIKAEILSGELKADEALPSMRLLASELKVSMITTTRAYSDLEAEGLIYTVRGKGCFVKGNEELVRGQYLEDVEKALSIAVLKGKAAGLTLDELQVKLEETYYDKRH